MTDRSADGCLQIEFYQQDFIPGFAAFLDSGKRPNAKAFCVVNIGSMLAAVEAGDLPKADIPYHLADSMMHEIIHAIEAWAQVEFSEDRVDALIESYREAFSPSSNPEGSEP